MENARAMTNDDVSSIVLDDNRQLSGVKLADKTFWGVLYTLFLGLSQVKVKQA